MKRLLSILLACCLAVCVAIPALAVEGNQQDIPLEQPADEAETDIITVSTLDELQIAVETSKEGSIIAVAETITLDGETIVSDKSITLVREENFTGALFSVSYNGGAISGFTIIDNGEKSATVVVQTLPAVSTTIEKCTFVGDGNNFSFMVNIFSGFVAFKNCTFTKSQECPLNINEGASATVESCIFTENTTGTRGGAINNAGTLLIKNTKIVRNVSGLGGGIHNSGNLTLDNCTLSNNDCTESERDDIYSTGVLTIYNSEYDSAGLYDVITGNKIVLPVVENTELAKLIYLTDEEAEDYFAPPASSDEDVTLPGVGDDNLDPPAPGDEPTIPEGGEDNGDIPSQGGDDNGESIPGGEPDNPEAEEDEDEQIPDAVPPIEGGESSQQPEDTTSPTDTDNDGDEADSNQGGAEQPEKPGEDNSDSGDDYIPVRPHKPVQRPSEPETDIQEPVQEPEKDPAPSLICGEAVIDTSRSVVLIGYDDGQLHEDDSLTRAQLATIVYRLLDDESITRYGAGQAIFDDVSAGAWYYEAVTTIAHAGIVNGIGEGRYDPEGLVTWAQALTVLSRFVEAQEWPLQYIQYNGWARQAMETAVALGWIEDSAKVAPDSTITRGEVVALINTVLEQYR